MLARWSDFNFFSIYFFLYQNNEILSYIFYHIPKAWFLIECGIEVLFLNFKLLEFLVNFFSGLRIIYITESRE